MLSEFISERVNRLSRLPELEFQNCDPIVGLKVRVFGISGHVEQREVVLSGLQQRTLDLCSASRSSMSKGSPSWGQTIESVKRSHLNCLEKKFNPFSYPHKLNIGFFTQTCPMTKGIYLIYSTKECNLTSFDTKLPSNRQCQLST